MERPSRHIAALAAIVSLVSSGGVLLAQEPSSDPWWHDTADRAAIEHSLQVADGNRKEIERALIDTASKHRESMAFLVSHMPARDLRTLDTSFLLENVALAHRAIAAVPWGESIPKSVFLNNVLPYANVTEKRERWRKDFFARFLPLVKDCKSPGEAAVVLNSKIFGILKVKYSTQRRRADQSPAESIATGTASCTGLSILLVDACRAVCVPARLAGIPSWVDKRGNHTWVEVWDQDWRFTGAAEPAELDRTWFLADAAKARADSPRHSIYAVSYQKTAVAFPMVWGRRRDPVSAVNVTHRYAKQGAKQQAAQLMVRVRESRSGARVIARVRIHPETDPASVLSGQSRGEHNDANDLLTFDVKAGGTYVIRVDHGSRIRIVTRRVDGARLLVEVALGVTSEIDRLGAEIEKAAAAWFAAPAGDRTAFEPGLEAALRADEAQARRAVWRAYRGSSIHQGLRTDFAANRVRAGDHESAYTLKKVGKKPAGGWPLFIAMHGGGGVPKRVNDSQWRHMQIYYRDQEDVGGYLYLALRAPNDSWNGFYDHYVWPLVAQLTRQLLVCEAVDPDRVFLMGYSHGGYGAFAIGPNIPDRFAAVHASAAAPTPGNSPAENLRNVVFTYMIGERDTRYGRLDRCRNFAAEIAKLREQDKEGYPVKMEFQAGHGHGGLPDRDKIKSMYPESRRLAPREVVWHTTGSTVDAFYWLSIPQPKGGQRIRAKSSDNRIELTTERVARLALGLDARLVDFDRPIQVVWNGRATTPVVTRSLTTLCESMLQRGDPGLAYTARVTLTAEAKPATPGSSGKSGKSGKPEGPAKSAEPGKSRQTDQR